MTFFAAIAYKDISSSNTRISISPSAYIVAGPSTLEAYSQTSTSFNPTFVNSNNTVMSSSSNAYTSDYANYFIVNNSTNNWVITLSLFSFSSKSMQITIKKTGSGTLTIQTPADSSTIYGINTTSNKSYTLSSTSAQSVTLLMTYGQTDTGTTDSTARIWHVI